ncbi:hypothetical protein BCR44DRAFT_1429927 [Catenaria anguillulae PL171]|uniref:Sfi1 spindle body protein-domain-containing protein n=1 Tax=Catenaria anguillulae PL171 TaxID=765915 RepID=A0A1Y2HT75_9FUNG|nr:hypothetical protein BCR44DRAFT_1429927 [Catenaria anguillulae PL171]
MSTQLELTSLAASAEPPPTPSVALIPTDNTHGLPPAPTKSNESNAPSKRKVPPPPPSFLTAMQQREQRRAALKQARLARQAAAELVAREAARKAAQLEADRAAKEAMEREREERQRQLTTAIEFARQAALKYRGIRPWKRAVVKLEMMERKATEWRVERQKKEAWRRWVLVMRKRWEGREQMADAHCASRALVEVLHHWKQGLATRVEAWDSAIMHRDARLRTAVIRTWKQAATQHKADREASEQAANARVDEMALRVLPRRCFRRWQAFVKQAKDERWKEYRRATMRNKIRVCCERMRECLIQVTHTKYVSVLASFHLANGSGDCLHRVEEHHCRLGQPR